MTAIEVLYREDFETEGIILCIVSSVISYALFTSIFGNQPIFEVPPELFSIPSNCFRILPSGCSVCLSGSFM